MAQEPVVVGVIGKPFGVHGEVYVRPDPDLMHDFDPGTGYLLEDGRHLVVSDTRIHGNRRLVSFEAVDDREGAEALRGTVLRVPREQVELEEGAVWAADLIGREVRDPDGAVVGVVEGFLDGPAHDYLVIARPDGGEALIPLVGDLVDLGEDAVVIQPVPGLLDQG